MVLLLSGKIGSVCPPKRNSKVCFNCWTIRDVVESARHADQFSVSGFIGSATQGVQLLEHFIQAHQSDYKAARANFEIGEPLDARKATGACASTFFTH